MGLQKCLHFLQFSLVKSNYLIKKLSRDFRMKDNINSEEIFTLIPEDLLASNSEGFKRIGKFFIQNNDLKTLEENDLIKDNAWIFADNVILFNLEDYLNYVRSSSKYTSKFIPAKREYSKSHPDGVEISIFKHEV